MSEGADGSCMCGAVRYRITFPTRFLAHCHCASCRRSVGAGVVTWVGVLAPQFAVTAGTITRYTSSPGTRRGFCATCGTSLTFESERWAGEVHVTRASLTDPIDRDRSVHVFYDEHVPWLTVGDPP